MAPMTGMGGSVATAATNHKAAVAIVLNDVLTLVGDGAYLVEERTAIGVAKLEGKVDVASDRRGKVLHELVSVENPNAGQESSNDLHLWGALLTNETSPRRPSE